MALKWYAATELTGDGSALDLVPSTGDYTDLHTGDKCFVMMNDLYTRIYQYDEALVANLSIFGTEIIPDGNVSGVGAWKEKRTTGLMTFWAGTVANEIDATVSEAGGVVSLDFICTGGIPGVGIWSDDLIPIPIQSITLNHGSDVAPTANYVYILKADQETLVVNSEWPATEHIKIAYCLVPSAAHVAAAGAYIHQNWNEGNEPSGMGHLATIGENIRLTQDGAHWHQGVAGNGATDDYITIVTGDTPDSAYFLSTAGVCFQMHRHTVPAFNSQTNPMLIMNAYGQAYKQVNDIRDEEVDAINGSLTNKYYNVVFWMVANKGGEYAPTLMNMPTGSYNGLQNAINDVDGYDVYDIPRQYKEDSATGFLVCRITFRQTSSAITVHNTTDLRGRIPGSASGTSLVASTEFADNQFKVYNVDDVTKIIDFDLSGLTTGNTRIITPADADMSMLSTADHTDITTDSVPSTIHFHQNLYDYVKTAVFTGQDGSGWGYFQSTRVFATQANGLSIYDTEGSSPLAEFYDNASAVIGKLEWNSLGSAVLYNSIDSENLIVATAGGAVELYHAGNAQILTLSEFSHTGAAIQNNVGAAFWIYAEDDEAAPGIWYMTSLSESSHILMNGLKAGAGGNNTMIRMDPDGPVELYHNGVKVVETYVTGGLRVRNATTSTKTATLYMNTSDVLLLRNEEDSGHITLFGNTSETVGVTLINADPDGPVELWHAGVKVFVTRDDGFEFNDDAGVLLGRVYNYNGNTVRHQSLQTSDHTTFYGKDSVDADSLMLDMDPDGAVDLYYAGVKCLNTRVNGLSIYDGSGYASVFLNSTVLTVKNYGTSALIKLQGLTSGEATGTMLVADPDGPVELYYNGLLTLATKANGLATHSSAEVGSYQSIQSYHHGEYDSGNALAMAHFMATDEEIDQVTMVMYSRFTELTHATRSSEIAVQGLYQGSADFVWKYLNGAFELYYAGVVAFRTNVEGIEVRAAADDISVIFLLDGSGSSQALIYGLSGSTYIKNDTPAGHVVLSGEKTGTGNNVMFDGDADGFTSLYHAGVLQLTTYRGSGRGGIVLYDDVGANTMQVEVDSISGNAFFFNTTVAAQFKYGGTNTVSGVWATIMSGDPDGACELYYAGVKAFQTTVDGIVIFDAAGTLTCSLTQNNSASVFKNTAPGGKFYLRGNQTTPATAEMIIMDPDGSTEIYHAGVKIFESDNLGLSIFGNATENAYIQFHNSSGTTQAQIRTDNTHSIFIGAGVNQDTGEGQSVVLRIFNGTSWENGLVVREAAGVDLYYHGVKTATTGSFNSRKAITLTATNPVSMIGGSGTPEGSVTAPIGCIFLRSDGGSGTTFYVKESGTGSTGWVAK